MSSKLLRFVSSLILALAFTFAGSSQALTAPSEAPLQNIQASPYNNTFSGTMNVARDEHTAVLLPNGNVLVAAGYNDQNGYLSSAEIYETTTGVWNLTSSLNVGRVGNTATLLPDGRVLVAGGYNNSDGCLSGAEIYDPQTGSWSLTTPMNQARADFTSTALADGRTLVSGGAICNGYTNSAELFDPATNVWTPAPSQPIPHQGWLRVISAELGIRRCGAPR